MLEIESAPEAGTMVTAEFPLEGTPETARDTAASPEAQP
jgi:hypothetical protein